MSGHPSCAMTDESAVSTIEWMMDCFAEEWGRIRGYGGGYQAGIRWVGLGRWVVGVGTQRACGWMTMSMSSYEAPNR